MKLLFFIAPSFRAESYRNIKYNDEGFSPLKKFKMPYIKIYIHAVWATKDRKPYLTEEIRAKVIDHIYDNARVKSINLDLVNGYKDHLHCLFTLRADQNIATVINLLKGESSFWVNKQKLTLEKFGWQDEYFAVSIGESQVDAVRKFIRNQEIHHKKKSFQQEYNEFIANYNFE